MGKSMYPDYSQAVVIRAAMSSLEKVHLGISNAWGLFSDYVSLRPETRDLINGHMKSHGTPKWFHVYKDKVDSGYAREYVIAGRSAGLVGVSEEVQWPPSERIIELAKKAAAPYAFFRRVGEISWVWMLGIILNLPIGLGILTGFAILERGELRHNILAIFFGVASVAGLLLLLYVGLIDRIIYNNRRGNILEALLSAQKTPATSRSPDPSPAVPPAPAPVQNAA